MFLHKQGPLFYWPSFLWCFYFFWISKYEVHSFKIRWKFSAFRRSMQSKQSKFKADKNFPRFPSFRFYPIPKIKNSDIPEKSFFTSNFEKSCNLDAKKTKNFMRQKLKDQDMFWLEKVKISEVSEFSILPYTQNWKLGNLGKCSFTSNFDRSCNLRCKSDTKLTEAKTWRLRYAFYQNLWKVLIPHFPFKLSQKRTMQNL